MACEIAGIGHSLDHQIDCVDDNFGRRSRPAVSRQSDGAAVEPAEALQELGGAAAIVATAASGTSMSPLVAGLAPRGQLVVVGVADDPIEVSTVDLVLGGRSIVGSLTGSAIENE